MGRWPRVQAARPKPDAYEARDEAATAPPHKKARCAQRRHRAAARPRAAGARGAGAPAWRAAAPAPASSSATRPNGLGCALVAPSEGARRLRRRRTPLPSPGAAPPAWGASGLRSKDRQVRGGRWHAPALLAPPQAPRVDAPVPAPPPVPPRGPAQAGPSPRPQRICRLQLSSVQAAQAGAAAAASASRYWPGRARMAAWRCSSPTRSPQTAWPHVSASTAVLVSTAGAARRRAARRTPAGMAQEAPAAASGAPARAVGAGAPARRPAAPALETGTAMNAETHGHAVCGDRVREEHLQAAIRAHPRPALHGGGAAKTRCRDCVLALRAAVAARTKSRATDGCVERAYCRRAPCRGSRSSCACRARRALCQRCCMALTIVGCGCHAGAAEEGWARG